MMKKLLLSLVAVVSFSGCSTSTPHTGTISENSNGDEYSIELSDNSIQVTAQFTEYQFIRDSESGFIGCTDIMNTIANEEATKLDKSINPISWETMKKDGYIDHGRDILTAIMNVNCRYTYKFN